MRIFEENVNTVMIQNNDEIRVIYFTILKDNI